MSSWFNIQSTSADGAGAEGAGNSGTDGAPLNEAIKHANPHHFIMGAQSSLPVDAAETHGRKLRVRSRNLLVIY